MPEPPPVITTQAIGRCNDSAEHQEPNLEARLQTTRDAFDLAKAPACYVTRLLIGLLSSSARMQYESDATVAAEARGSKKACLLSRWQHIREPSKAKD